MKHFTYDAIPGRVVFGNGSLERLAAETDVLDTRRIMLIAAEEESGLADEAAAILGDHAVGRFSGVAQHVPADKAAEAIRLAEELDADGVVSIGGGSATGFGKVVRRERDVAFIAVPTTYAGSEMTTIWGRTERGRKQTGRDPRVKPDTVIYDPQLTVTLPAIIAGPSGMNAMAHCVEALYAPGASPVVSLLALDGIRALAANLPLVCGDGDGIEARSEVLYGAYLAGVALASGGTALHHKTCHVLGGMFDLNHGDMNAVVLGHALAYNEPAIGELMPQIASALGVPPDRAPLALFELAGTIGAPTSLEAIGMPADGLDEAARRVVEEAAGNVRQPDEASIRQMLDDAFHGRPPQAGRT